METGLTIKTINILKKTDSPDYSPRKEWLLITVIISIIIIAIIILWYNLYISPRQDIASINALDFDSLLPLSAEDHKEFIENADIHFKLHNSKLSVISMCIAIAAALLTYIAFHVQYVYNKRQKSDLARERCENQYFHLLDIFRRIVNNISIDNVGKGKRAFHYVFYEYKAIYNEFYQSLHLARGKTSGEINSDVVNIWEDGISPDFSLEIRDKNSTSDWGKIIDSFRDRLLSHQNKSLKKSDEKVKYIADYSGRQIKYFDGHKVWLFPYFNYLLLIFDFISEHQSLHKTFNMLPYLYKEMTEHEIGVIYAYSKAHPEKFEGHEEKLQEIFRCIESNNEKRYFFDKENFIR